MRSLAVILSFVAAPLVAQQTTISIEEYDPHATDEASGLRPQENMEGRRPPEAWGLAPEACEPVAFWSPVDEHNERWLELT